MTALNRRYRCSHCGERGHTSLTCPLLAWIAERLADGREVTT